MQRRPLLVAAGAIAAGIILSACQSNAKPASSTSNNYGIESSPAPTSAATASATPNNVVSSQKGTMKTLADFEQIPATKATIVTTKGEISFDLFRDKAPITIANFLSLAKAHFYDGIVFHRVIPDFMAQVGDPLTKDASKQDMWGSGGPGYTIPDEFDPSLKFDSEGIVAMANAGANTGGSQIFITYAPTPWLDGHHTIFGKVTSGMEVLEKITVGDKILSIKYQ